MCHSFLTHHFRTCWINDQCRIKFVALTSMPINAKSNLWYWHQCRSINIDRYWSSLIAIDLYWATFWVNNRILIRHWSVFKIEHLLPFNQFCVIHVSFVHYYSWIVWAWGYKTSIMSLYNIWLMSCMGVYVHNVDFGCYIIKIRDLLPWLCNMFFFLILQVMG